MSGNVNKRPRSSTNQRKLQLQGEYLWSRHRKKRLQLGVTLLFFDSNNNRQAVSSLSFMSLSRCGMLFRHLNATCLFWPEGKETKCRQFWNQLWRTFFKPADFTGCGTSDKKHTIFIEMCLKSYGYTGNGTRKKPEKYLPAAACG